MTTAHDSPTKHAALLAELSRVIDELLTTGMPPQELASILDDIIEEVTGKRRDRD